jgi:Icc-related predicted phosphoesterase
MMNDSHRCSIDFQDICKLAAEEAFYIKLKLKEWKDYQLKGIVVTHTAPCEETLDPKYDGELSNEWYWNPYMRPLLEEFSDQIHVWCHGHTHARNEAVVDGVKVVCNPRGYPGENPKWRPLTVEI